MSKAVFIHNPGTKYDDDPATRYHFPKMYFKRAEPVIGDDVLYYQSGPNGGYTGTAKVLNIVEDPSDPTKHFYANIVPRSYINRGKQVWAVRPISENDFMEIVAYAISETQELPRVEIDAFEVRESFQEEFISEFERKTVEVVLNKKVRSRLFRERVIKAYDKQCALTGMRFINGGGRAEVQAAHIKSVEANGPDSVNNGIALSGTIHWMFDRGLLSLSNDYEILVSRKVNNIDEVDRLINKDRRAILPKNEAAWPHPAYLDWHRSHHNFEAA